MKKIKRIISAAAAAAMLLGTVPPASAATAKLLTAPFLQLPDETSVNVVWFTETEGTANRVLLFENGEEAEATRTFDAVTTKMSRTRSGSQIRDIYRHEAVVTGLPEYDGDEDKITYKVMSDSAESDFYRLQAKAQPGTDMKILLTSDSQLKNMTPANMQKIIEKFGEGEIGAVFFAGDLVNVPDSANEWFDDAGGGAFFPSMQGFAKKTYPSQKGTYSGGAVIQYAPMYTAIGNHEVMGQYTKSTPANEFNLPSPVAYAEALYEERNSDSDTTNDIAPEDKADFIRDNSFNTITYEELFSLPKNDKGNERYYAETIGDVRLVVLEITRIWRGNGVGSASKYSEAPGVTGETNPSRQWGSHIFESIAEGSDQYVWLQNELESEEFKNAKYKVVMFHHQFHSLGGNVVPAYTDPVEKTVTLKDGRDMIIYEYPLENDQMVGIEPLLEDAGVDLILNGHSHLWNRFITKKGTNVLETSNVGNTYQAFLDLKSRTDSVPAAFNPGNQYNYLAAEWDAGDYILQGDPYGLSPVMPSVAPLYDNPYIESNTITAFSVFDTGTGIVDSYYYNTDDTSSPIVHFDSFSIFQQTPENKEKQNKISLSAQSEDNADVTAVNPETGYIYAADNQTGVINIYKDGRELEKTASVELAALTEEAVPGRVTELEFADDKLAVIDENGLVIFTGPDGVYISHANLGRAVTDAEFTADGKYLAAAAEASVSVITPESMEIRAVDFTQLNDNKAALIAENIILEKDKTPAESLKTGKISIGADNTLYAALTSSNAIAVIDLESGTLSGIEGLGFKNNLTHGNEVDLSEDGAVNPAWANTRSAYIPSDVEAYEKDGESYVVTVNGGRLAASLMTSAQVRDTAVDVIDQTKVEGLPDCDAYSKMVNIKNNVNFLAGTDTFTIYKKTGNGLERIFESENLSEFSGLENSVPVSVSAAEIDGKSYAYISLDSNGGMLVYDITEPQKPVFYDFAADTVLEESDIIPAEKSSGGYPKLVTANGVITVYEQKDGYVKPVTNLPGKGASGGSLGGISYYTLSFETDGAEAIDPQRIQSGGKAEKPENPEREGFTFGGWFTDSEFGTEFDFNTKILSNTVVYAKWTEQAEDTGKVPEDAGKEEITDTGSGEDEAVSVWENPFADVSEDSWFYTAVEFVSSKGLFRGVTDNKFAPDMPVTRAMLVTVLYRAEGEPAVSGGTMPFDDVSADSYYSGAVAWAKENGIVSGVTENRFAPDSNILREQLAAVIARYAAYKGMDTVTDSEPGFTDASEISDYAADAVKYCVEAGVISGNDNNEFRAGASATRAETANVLKRFFEIRK